MITPLRNGAVIRIEEYGNKYLRADVYQIDNVYMFVGTPYYRDGLDENRHADVVLGGQCIYREAKSPERYDTLICHRDNIHLHKDWSE